MDNIMGIGMFGLTALSMIIGILLVISTSVPSRKDNARAAQTSQTLGRLALPRKWFRDDETSARESADEKAAASEAARRAAAYENLLRDYDLELKEKK